MLYVSLSQQSGTMTKTPTKWIIFITGAFIGNNCWDEWKLFFENRGYRCKAPAWPNKIASPEELRNRHPDSAIASNRLNNLTEYFAEFVKAIPEEPILIGHSIGGLIVELLLQRGFGIAGIAIHSFPSAGAIEFNFTLLKALLTPMAFFSSPQKSYMISFKKWKNTIANGMTCEMQKQSFYLFAIPESKLIIRDAFKSAAKINFSKDRPPLLLISGSRDKVIPASLIFANYEKYKSGKSITDYRDFKGRNHLLFKHPSWKDELEFILFWLRSIKIAIANTQ